MCFRFLQVAWWFYRTGELPHHDAAHVEGVQTPPVAADGAVVEGVVDPFHPAPASPVGARQREPLGLRADCARIERLNERCRSLACRLSRPMRGARGVSVWVTP